MDRGNNVLDLHKLNTHALTSKVDRTMQKHVLLPGLFECDHNFLIGLKNNQLVMLAAHRPIRGRHDSEK